MKRRTFIRQLALSAAVAAALGASSVYAQQKTVKIGVLHSLSGTMAISETVLKDTVRDTDIVARYGGEEFVMILPETATDGAVVFAERLRERIREHRFEVDANRIFHLTCSVGVATFPSARVASTDDLFARADEALYRAKSGGRNLVRT